MAQDRQVLSGIRVLDLTESIAGPFAGKQFADFGADVIKIERPGQGDPARRHGPFPGGRPDSEASALFLHLNRNKRGVTLDISSESGREIFLNLVRTADIVLESFPPGTMEHWGLGFDVLARTRESVVLGRLTPFGQTGPYRDYRGNDIVYYAFGHMQGSGDPELGPLKKAVNTVECQVGNVFATAVLGAFLAARRQGAGQVVDVAGVETQLGSIDYRMLFLLAHQYNGHVTNREENAIGGSVLPNGTFPCADGYVQITTPPNWVGRMAATIQDEQLSQIVADPDGIANPENAETIQSIVYSWLVSHTKQECFLQSAEHGWAVFPLNTIADVINDPQLQALQFFVEMDHPVAGRLRYPGAPWRMSRGGFQFRRPAPMLGQHNEEIYVRELSMDPVDVQRLFQVGVL